jgi:hypothetical protein
MPHFLETVVSVIPLSRSRTMAERPSFIGARPIRTPPLCGLNSMLGVLRVVAPDRSFVVPREKPSAYEKASNETL